MDRRSFLASSAATFASGLAARSHAADLPGAASLKEEVAILRQALALHPGLYRYQTVARYEARLARFADEYVKPIDLAKRYLLLSRFMSDIRCGHSYANFYNQTDAVAAQLFDRPTRLPFHFVWVGSDMVVVRDPTNRLVRGTRIARLNARRPVDLRNALIPLVRGDGHNDAKRISLLEARGDEGFETFDVFQGLIAAPQTGIHLLETIGPNGKRARLQVSAIGLKARQGQQVTLDTKGDAALWSWSVRSDGIAVLTMPTWALYDSKWDWKSWLDARLNSLSGARGLIVDLRDNEGGEDCGDVILARMITQRFVPPAIEQRIRFQRTPDAINRYLETWDKSFRTLGVGATSLGNGYFRRPGQDRATAIEPAKPGINVPVAVLISPVNSSATFHFAQNFRAIGGRLYGRPTGGNLRGINGGAFFFVRLPASGLEFDLPLVGYFPLTPQPDAGLQPDVFSAPSVRDIADGHDAALERVAADLARA